MSAKKSQTIHSHPKKIYKSSDRTNKKRHYPTYIKNQKIQRKRKKIVRKKSWQTRIKRVMFEVGTSLVLLGILLYLLSLFTFTVAKVEGYSMLPTLNHKEWVFVSKVAKPRRFKLVLHRDPISKETSVRRVIGLPGESIRYEDDQLYVNDQDVFERFLEPEVKQAKASKNTYTKDWWPEVSVIPKGQYLVLGDNRPYAADSRDYGYIDEKNIIGVVEMRILPIHLLQQF